MSESLLVVGSTNPVKIRAAQDAIVRAFPEINWQVIGIAVTSGVAEQPMDENETRLGAVNRLNELQRLRPDAQFYAAFEGGYARMHGTPFTFAYVAISDGTNTQIGRSGSLPLPTQIGLGLEAGGELGPLMDQLFNATNIKQKGGAIGLLTNGLVDRSSIYRDTMTLLLAPYLHPKLYQHR